MANYLFRNRPPGIGCQPDGWVNRETWMPAKEIQERFFLGQVEYAEPLPFEQVKRYELWPESELERAEMIFWLEGEDAGWLRTDYLSQPLDRLEKYAARYDQKAQAALIILRHQTERIESL